MKKVIYSLLFVFTAVFTACEEELPKANFDLYELKSLEASAGDMNVTLTWEDYENARPSEYLVIWTAGTAESDGGQMTVEADKKRVVIENLENDMTYSFSVQPCYAGGLASRTSVNCTPKNARYPVTDLTATAGNERVRLNWTKPASDRFTNYQITINPGGQVVTLDDTSLESYVVEGLTNDQQYTFSIIASYPTGNSVVAEVSAIPGLVYPVLISNELVIWESLPFVWNDMYFMAGEVQSVNWDFGDGTTSTDMTPTHAYEATGDYTVSVTVTYTDNTTESGSIVVTVVTYKWNSCDLKFGELFGPVKTSNPVFSPDGRTMYVPTSFTNSGHLFAIDVASGEIKWCFAISKATYGGGALVGTDGTIYQCVDDNSVDNVLAIHPNGVKKWSVKLDGAIGAFPALSADGVLYCLTNTPTLYALDANTGDVLWTKETLDATAKGCAVAVDKSGNVYAGTYGGIYFYTADGDKRFEPITVKVTERGSFAMDGDRLYATLTAGAGLVAINMQTGEELWKHAAGSGAKNDSYFPIVDKEGTVYFSVKTENKVYAITKDNNLKWSVSPGGALIYNGLVLSDDGVLYTGCQNNTNLYGLNTSDGSQAYTTDVGQKVMAAGIIGPDRRLYLGTLGTANIGAIKAFAIDKAPETSSWGMRGGDLQGSNCQK